MAIRLYAPAPQMLIVQGSTTVLIGGQMAARLGDMTAHTGRIVVGDPTVLIGGGASDNDDERDDDDQGNTMDNAADDGQPFAEICS